MYLRRNMSVFLLRRNIYDKRHLIEKKYTSEEKYFCISSSEKKYLRERIHIYKEIYISEKKYTSEKISAFFLNRNTYPRRNGYLCLML